MLLLLLLPSLESGGGFNVWDRREGEKKDVSRIKKLDERRNRMRRRRIMQSLSEE